MAIYDVAMLVILLGAILLGLWKGAVWQLAPIASLIAGYIVSMTYGERLAPTFGDTAPMNRYIAMLVIFLVVSLAVYLVARMIRGYLEKQKFTEYDRHLGGLLGAVKGVLLCVAITFFSMAMLPSLRDDVVGSQSGYYSAVLMDKLHVVLPDEIHDKLHPYIHGLDDLNEGAEAHRDVRTAQSEVGDEESDTTPILGPPTEEDVREVGRRIVGDVKDSVRDRVSKEVDEATRGFLDRELGIQPTEESTENVKRIGGDIMNRVLEGARREAQRKQ